MAIDRSKYRASSSEELQAESEKIKAREQSGRGSFLKVESGINVFRLMPAPLKAKSSLFCFPSVTAFLPLLVDEYDKEKGETTGKKVVKRKPVFNAKVHGGLSRDLVEEYIACASEYFAATIEDKKEILSRMKVITDFKSGIKPSSSWVAYAYKELAGVKTYGRLQITDGVHKQMDTLCLRQGASGKPIVVDLFSHPDTGKKIQWTSDPLNVDPKAKNKISILFEQESSLTDEELEMLESWEPLENLYKNCFKRFDFEKQLQGLQRFDAEKGYKVFDSPLFQNIIDLCREEIERVLPPEDDDEQSEEDKQLPFGGESETRTQQATAPVQHTSTNNANSDIPAILQGMDKKTLIAVIEKLELPVEFRPTTPPSKLRELITESICSVYELEVSDEEGISAIIDGAFDEEGAQEESQQEEPATEAQNPVTVNAPVTSGSGAKAKSSLLEKYKNQK